MRKMHKHFRIKKLLSAYQDGEVLPKEKAVVERHIEYCRDCKKYSEELQRMSSYLKKWRDEDISIDLEQKIKKDVLKNKMGMVRMKHKNRLIPVAAGVGALIFLAEKQLNNGLMQTLFQPVMTRVER